MAQALSGRSIQGHGITPDVLLNLPKDQQVANAVVTYESDLFGSLQAAGASVPKTKTSPGAVSGAADHPINPKILGTAGDTQLSSALEWLRTHPRATATR